MSSFDFIILFAYLVVTFGLGMWAGRGQHGPAFWVAGRKSPFLLLLLSVISTQVGAGALLGIASAAYSTGIGLFFVSAISAVVGFVAVGFAAPTIKRFGDRHDAVSIAEFLRARYGRPTQYAAAGVIVFVYVSFLAAQFLALGGLLTVWGGVEMEVALLFATVGLIVYTAFAGLRGDLATDAVHFVAMLAGFGILLLLGVFPSGGEMVARLPTAFWSPLAFGGWSFLLVGVFLGGVLPFVSMEVWQRAYATSSPRVARRVFWIAPLIVIPFYVFAVELGFSAYLVLPERLPADLAPLSVLGQLTPVGLRGLVIAALIATLLSTANSMALAVSAAVERDLLAPLGIMRGAPRVLRDRGLTLLVGIGGYLAALAVPSIVQSTLNAFYVLGTLFLPILATFFWKRATQAGATSSIVAGAVVTLAALPWLPIHAFIPGLILSVPIFFGVSLFTRHSKQEDPDLVANLNSQP